MSVWIIRWGIGCWSTTWRRRRRGRQASPSEGNYWTGSSKQITVSISFSLIFVTANIFFFFHDVIFVGMVLPENYLLLPCRRCWDIRLKTITILIIILVTHQRNLATGPLKVKCDARYKNLQRYPKLLQSWC